MVRRNVLFSRIKLHYLRKRQIILRRMTLISRKFWRRVDFCLGRSEIICPCWQISFTCVNKKYYISTEH